MSDTLRFIQGLAARSDRPLNQFAVDHLVEILRHRRALDEQSGRDYSLAMHLIRQRTTVAARTKAFRFSAPFVAKRFSEAAASVIEIYSDLAIRGTVDGADQSICRGRFSVECE